MGGRKSYSNKKYLGSSKGVKEESKKLKEFIKEKDALNVTKQSLVVFTIASKPLKYSTYSAKLFPEVIRNSSRWYKEKDADKVRNEIVTSWVKVKQQNKISVPKEIDRIIVDKTFKKVREGFK